MKSLTNKIRLKPNGFSLVEVLLTLALFLILASLGIGTYFRYYSFSLVNQDVNSTQSVLHQTRFKAMKNPYSSNYGVFLNTGNSELILFRDTYTPGNSENLTFELEQLNISDLNLQPSPGVTNQILFENSTGKTQNSGTFTISNTDFSYDFSINLQGAFEK